MPTFMAGSQALYDYLDQQRRENADRRLEALKLSERLGIDLERAKTLLRQERTLEELVKEADQRLALMRLQAKLGTAIPDDSASWLEQQLQMSASYHESVAEAQQSGAFKTSGLPSLGHLGLK